MATAELSTLRAPTESNLPTVRAGFFDLQGFELLQRVAKAFASSTLVPKQYQGDVANCMIALNLARRLGADELMVMQNLYIVHGNPGWSSKFLIASVNACGRYESLRYEWRGQEGDATFGCRAWTIEKSTGEKLVGVWVDWRMVRAEGWDSKSGSKWKTMPEQMFIYRAAAFWQRAYAPEISMGLSTAEELADVVDVREDGSVKVTTETLRADMRQVDAETGEIKRRVFDPAAEPPAPSPAALADNPSPTFDFQAFADRIKACKDLEMLQLLSDEAEDLPEGEQRDQVMQALQQRDNELAAARAAQSANPPAGRRGRASGMSVE